MSQNNDSIFLYLKKENIDIDKTEYEFQMQSHPDYPSLLSISDTLNFFNIENFVVRVGFEDFDHLPNRFIALLNTEISAPQLYFIERIGYRFFYATDKKQLEITNEELEKRWRSIVLLIEKISNFS